MPTIEQLKQDMNNQLEEMKKVKGYDRRCFQQFIMHLRDHTGYPEDTEDNIDNDIQIFKKIFQSPNKLYSDNQTIFHIVPKKIPAQIDYPTVVCCMEKALEIASLEQGEHDTHVLNAEDEDGFTPLHHIAVNSARASNLTRIYFEQAQKNNCELNPTSSQNGTTPLHMDALTNIKSDNINTINMYSSHHIKDDAALNNILQKADKIELDVASEDTPYPPILCALKKANFNTAEKLWEAGANFDFKLNKDSESPLEWLDRKIGEETQLIKGGKGNQRYLKYLQEIKQKTEPDLQTSEAANTVQKLSMLEEFQRFGGDEPTESSQFKNRF